MLCDGTDEAARKKAPAVAAPAAQEAAPAAKEGE